LAVQSFSILCFLRVFAVENLLPNRHGNAPTIVIGPDFPHNPPTPEDRRALPILTVSATAGAGQELFA
jgi:hypothetical protein